VSEICNWIWLTRLKALGNPLISTAVSPKNPVPLIVTVRPGAPAVVDSGFRLVSVGIGLKGYGIG